MRTKIIPEDQHRQTLLKRARTVGCEQELIQIFNKIDGLLRHCTNLEEREAIAIMGIQEVHHLITRYNPGELNVNGKIII